MGSNLEHSFMKHFRHRWNKLKFSHETVYNWQDINESSFCSDRQRRPSKGTLCNIFHMHSLFYSNSTSVKYAWLCVFCRWGNWSSERVSKLHRVTASKGRAGVTWGCLCPGLVPVSQSLTAVSHSVASSKEVGGGGPCWGASLGYFLLSSHLIARKG